MDVIEPIANGFYLFHSNIVHGLAVNNHRRMSGDETNELFYFVTADKTIKLIVDVVMV